ncbi:hypothetical protein H4218_001640 [Coemansia sp. IMI 209128]|nr:hypothetical protein H4218_001640 [Coemansia sp. IMI 209128]
MSSTSATSSSDSPPATPPTNRTANSQPMVTPPNATPAPVSLLPSAIRRVHFSPSNEEIHSQTAPHSSPTRARLRPYSRSILKRSSTQGDSDQQHPSSDGDHGDRAPHNGRAMLEPAARVLFGSPSAAPSVGGDAPQTFEEAFPAAVKRLHELVLDGEAANALGAIIYNKLCGLSAKFPTKLAGCLEDTERLLDCVERDLTDESASRQVVLVAVKCLGCILHIASVCSAVPAARVGALLVAMLRRTSTQFKADKPVCQASVWCISMLRAPPASFQPLIPDLAKLCSRVLSAFSMSTSVQFECLSAIESLLRRTPAAMREVFHLWVLPVFFCVVNPVRSIRTNADSIIRQNIPWIAADLHGPEMDAQAQQFLEANFDRLLELSHQLFGRGEPVLLSRVWGMYVTIFAKHCRTRLNDMLKVVQQCFNSTDSQVLVAALMQWRCLIYAFYHSKQLRRKKCIELILTPIALLLKTGRQSVGVRLACVRCWATLVYALGDEIGSNIDVITGVPKLLEAEPDVAVRGLVARVLAALLNQFVLPEDKVPRFVIPQMIIGTTTLAASDGRGLSTTHGPFSSDSEYSGDHTAIMCRYVVGLSTTSPTLPVILDAMCAFISSGLALHRLPDTSECSLDWREAAGESDFKSYGELCDLVALALASLEASSAANGANTRDCSHGESQIPETIRKLVLAYGHATTSLSFGSLGANRRCDKSAITLVPRAMLYQAITRRLSEVLSRYCMDGESQFTQHLDVVGWMPGAFGSANLADEPVDKISFDLTLSVCQDQHRSDGPNQSNLGRTMGAPTYLGMVKACGFADEVERLDQPVEHMDATHSAPLFLPVAPQSGPASHHELGDVAAMICAITRYLQYRNGGILIDSRSRVEYFISALESALSWVPLFEDHLRGFLSAAVVRSFIYLLHRTPPPLQEPLRRLGLCECDAWDSRLFWRASYTAIYDVLSCDSFELSPEYMSTFMHLLARCRYPLDDAFGAVYWYMTAHLLLLSGVPTMTPDLSQGLYSWRDILVEHFVLADPATSSLHAFKSCERLLSCLLDNLGFFGESDLDCVRTVVLLLVRTLFRISDSNAGLVDVRLGEGCLDMGGVPGYERRFEGSAELVSLVNRLLCRLDGGMEDSGVGEDSGGGGVDVMEAEDSSVSAMPQPVARESEVCGTPRSRKRKRAKRHRPVTVDSSRESSPDLPPPLPVSALERVRRLLEEMESVVDSSTLQPDDICHVQMALAGMQLKLCQAMRDKL